MDKLVHNWDHSAWEKNLGTDSQSIQLDGVMLSHNDNEKLYIAPLSTGGTRIELFKRDVTHVTELGEAAGADGNIYQAARIQIKAGAAVKLTSFHHATDLPALISQPAAERSTTTTTIPPRKPGGCIPCERRTEFELSPTGIRNKAPIGQNHP